MIPLICFLVGLMLLSLGDILSTKKYLEIHRIFVEQPEVQYQYMNNIRRKNPSELELNPIGGWIIQKFGSRWVFVAVLYTLPLVCVAGYYAWSIQGFAFIVIGIYVGIVLNQVADTYFLGLEIEKAKSECGYAYLEGR